MPGWPARAQVGQVTATHRNYRRPGKQSCTLAAIRFQPRVRLSRAFASTRQDLCCPRAVCGFTEKGSDLGGNSALRGSEARTATEAAESRWFRQEELCPALPSVTLCHSLEMCVLSLYCSLRFMQFYIGVFVKKMVWSTAQFVVVISACPQTRSVYRLRLMICATRYYDRLRVFPLAHSTNCQIHNNQVLSV